jgi:hypothetical protein
LSPQTNSRLAPHISAARFPYTNYGAPPILPARGWFGLVWAGVYNPPRPTTHATTAHACPTPCTPPSLAAVRLRGEVRVWALALALVLARPVARPKGRLIGDLPFRKHQQQARPGRSPSHFYVRSGPGRLCRLRGCSQRPAGVPPASTSSSLSCSSDSTTYTRAALGRSLGS